MLIQVHRTDDYFTRSILRAHQVVEVESTDYPNDPQDFADPRLKEIAQLMWKLGPDARCGLEDLLACEEMSPHNALLTAMATAGEIKSCTVMHSI